MYLQEIFEVVIGLVFIWLVLSTATMQVGEWISNLLNMTQGSSFWFDVLVKIVNVRGTGVRPA